jgi:hypothetical protein
MVMASPQSPGQWSDPGQPTTPSWTAPGDAPAPLPYAPAYQDSSPPGFAAPPGYGSRTQPQTNGLAVAALVCSVAGIVAGFTFPVGAILGHVALKQLRERGESGAGLAKAGIIIGWIGTALMLAFVVLLIALFAQGLSQVD